jgi:hypothetical protein
MKTFFIRHGENFSISNKTVDQLRKERKIAFTTLVTKKAAYWIKTTPA